MKMKNILSVLVFEAVLLMSSAHANILFCDFANIGRLGISNLEQADANLRLNKLWLTDDNQPFGYLSLDKLYSYAVSDESIKLELSANSVDQKESFEIRLDLALKPVTRISCTSQWGANQVCSPVTEMRHIGKIEINKTVGIKNYSFKGDANCVWQYRNL